MDSSAKCNASSKPDFDVPAKLGQEGLDRGSVAKAFARGEIDGHGDVLDVLLGVDSSAKRNASSEPDFDVPAKLGQEGLDG